MIENEVIPGQKTVLNHCYVIRLFDQFSDFGLFQAKINILVNCALIDEKGHSDILKYLDCKGSQDVEDNN